MRGVEPMKRRRSSSSTTHTNDSFDCFVMALLRLGVLLVRLKWLTLEQILSLENSYFASERDLLIAFFTDLKVTSWLVRPKLQKLSYLGTPLSACLRNGCWLFEGGGGKGVGGGRGGGWCLISVLDKLLFLLQEYDQSLQSDNLRCIDNLCFVLVLFWDVFLSFALLMSAISRLRPYCPRCPLMNRIILDTLNKESI